MASVSESNVDFGGSLVPADIDTEVKLEDMSHTDIETEAEAATDIGTHNSSVVAHGQVAGVFPVAKGGTGATSAGAALTALGATPLTTLNARLGAAVLDLAALRAVAVAGLTSGEQVNVQAVLWPYYWSATGVGADNGGTIIVPTAIIPPAPGRWFRLDFDVGGAAAAAALASTPVAHGTATGAGVHGAGATGAAILAAADQAAAHTAAGTDAAGTARPASGGNADTVDGSHAADFEPAGALRPGDAETEVATATGAGLLTTEDGAGGLTGTDPSTFEPAGALRPGDAETEVATATGAGLLATEDGAGGLTGTDPATFEPAGALRPGDAETEVATAAGAGNLVLEDGAGGLTGQSMGVAIGNVVQVVDVGGAVAGLPALDGSLLTAVDAATVDGTAAATVVAGAADGATAVQPGVRAADTCDDSSVSVDWTQVLGVAGSISEGADGLVCTTGSGAGQYVWVNGTPSATYQSATHVHRAQAMAGSAWYVEGYLTIRNAQNEGAVLIVFNSGNTNDYFQLLFWDAAGVPKIGARTDDGGSTIYPTGGLTVPGGVRSLWACIGAGPLGMFAGYSLNAYASRPALHDYVMLFVERHSNVAVLTNFPSVTTIRDCFGAVSFNAPVAAAQAKMRGFRHVER